MRKFICILIFLFFLPLSCLAEDYIIGDGDTLQISVWGVPELSVGAVVRPDGKITLPAVGDVVASGFTPSRLSEKLSEDLGTFVKKPIVTVTVGGITNSKVYIFGGGVAASVINLRERTTLLKFLCTLGDLQNADLKHAYILRNGEKVDVDFYDLFVKGDLSRDIDIKPEDMIYFPDNELNKIYVMGAVGNPKYVFYREGVRILDVILESGGFTKFAKESKVLILREEGDEMKEIFVNVKDLMKEGDLSQNLNLKRGDFIIIKEGIF